MSQNDTRNVASCYRGSHAGQEDILLPSTTGSKLRQLRMRAGMHWINARAIPVKVKKSGQQVIKRGTHITLPADRHVSQVFTFDG